MHRQAQLHFYDAADPRNIPSGAHAAVAANGEFAWRDSDVRRMASVFRFLEHDDGVGDLSRWAPHARAIDIEPECIWPPERAMPFLVARAKHYGDATAYCNRSTLPEVRDLVKRAEIEILEWVSTLDGTQDVAGAWAVQYYGGVHTPWDLSVLLGKYNFPGK